MPAAPHPDAHVMRCMEIFGGNRSTQQSIVTPGLDAWLYSRPYAPAGATAAAATPDAGGDVHYLTSCATGRVTRLLLADVSGHGQRVADAARALKALLGAYANYIDQLRFVAAVNERFGSMEADGAKGLFATAVVATYYAPDAELAVCSAGHPPPLMYDAARGSWRVLDVEAPASAGASNLPWGVDDHGDYYQTALRLGPADLVLFFTDALPEARREGGPMLGLAGLRDLAEGLDPADPAGVIPALLDGVNAHRGGVVAQDDDVTVLLVRRNDRAPRPSPALAAKGAALVAWHAARDLLAGRSPALPEWSARSLVGAWRRVRGQG